MGRGGGQVGKNTSVYLPMFDSYDSFNHRGGISRASRYIFGRSMQCMHLGVTVKTQSSYQANVGWKGSRDFRAYCSLLRFKKGFTTLYDCHAPDVLTAVERRENVFP